MFGKVQDHIELEFHREITIILRAIYFNSSAEMLKHHT